MARRSEQEDAIAVVTVHGTGDTAKEPDGPKWWQRGSAFSERLKANLAARGVKAEIVPHFWSGANSATDRESGADTLAKLIQKCAGKYKGVHVIGHSHGGNVANDAADFLRWGRRRRKKRDPISSVTTVGTPYFNSKTGVAQVAAGWAFMGVTWASVILFPLVALGWLLYVLATYFGAAESAADKVRASEAVGEGHLLGQDALERLTQSEQTAAIWSAVLFVAYLVVVGLAIRFMWGMSTRGIRRVMRPKRQKNAPTSIFSIWHRNDEAISFLQKIEQAPIEAFPKGSLYRGSRTSAVSLGVLAVIFMGIVAPSILLGASAGIGREAVFSWLEIDPADNSGDTMLGIVVVSMMALLLAPVIFSLFFLLYRYLVGSVLELTARGALNRRIGGILRGIAYGKDGDQILCNISTTSHTHGSRELVLDGEVAGRMQEKATGAANALLDKYRWSLFSVGADSNASLNELTSDAMTWDSLIHTTYFDQPEVADAIADHIAAEAKRLGEV